MEILQLLTEVMQVYGVDVKVLGESPNALEQLDRGLRKILYEDFDYRQLLAQADENMMERSAYDVLDSFGIHYITIALGGCRYCVIGPFLHYGWEANFEEIAGRNGFNLSQRDYFEKYCKSLPVVADGSLFRELVYPFLKRLFMGRAVQTIQTVRLKETGQGAERWSQNLPYPEKESMRTIEARYRVEDELLKAVEEGNYDRALLTNFRKFQLEKRYEGSLRAYKNSMLTFNTLCRKSVQRAQVHPAHIDEISSKLAKEIEDAVNVDVLRGIYEQMIRKYCLLVRNYSLQGYSGMVRDALNYIDFHVKDELSLSVLAEQIAVNRKYLSSRFKEEIGKTVTEYINEKRIRESLRYLVVSDMPVQRVAELVGIYDVNYYSRLFKKIEGMTPSEYRRRFMAQAK